MNSAPLWCISSLLNTNLLEFSLHHVFEVRHADYSKTDCPVRILQKILDCSEQLVQVLHGKANIYFEEF